MDKRKKRIDRMNSFVVGIDLGEKESSVIYMAPDGEIKEKLSFDSGRLSNIPSLLRYPMMEFFVEDLDLPSLTL